MADAAENPLALLRLEDELTCSVCLSPFDCPVTIPCGHNFCHYCLLEAWKDADDSPSCPQCRAVFPAKPELKKNTVLSSVVENFTMRSCKMHDEEEAAAVAAGVAAEEAAAEVAAEEAASGAAKGDVIRCDTCMQTEASRTCLTCMASYCEEHLRPHLDNPVFRQHQLRAPVGDLPERICGDHHKLMEFFCSAHGRPICSLCLQQVHKGCAFVSPEEQRNAKESDLRGKLGVLDGKITKNEDVISQMKDMQGKLTELASDKRKALEAEYQQMRDSLVRAERDALTAVDHELESGLAKLKDLAKRFAENVDSLSAAKEHVRGLLGQSQTMAFLQVSFELPDATKCKPFAPRIVLDSKKVVATEAFAGALKEYLAEILTQPVEERRLTAAPDGKTSPVPESAGSPQEYVSAPEPPRSQKQKRKPRSHSPGGPPVPPLFHPHLQPHLQPHFQPYFEPPGYPGGFGGWNPSYSYDFQFRGGPNKTTRSKKATTARGKKSTENKMENKDHFSSKESLVDSDGKDQPKGSAPTASLYMPLDITSPEKRHELLKYASVLTFNPTTAHRRIALTEGNAKASLSDEHINYPDHPARFTVCSQVLAGRGFAKGRHYWEVRLSCNNFVGVGLTYGSIHRKGPTSRLGRNNQSWCVEWFNGKLSAWHNSGENVLDNANPKRVGVLLDCEAGTATFYNITDRAYPFHSFMFSFAEAVYPAFWIFSSGSSITLCKPSA